MSLPDILKTKPMATVDTMSIHTSILEPVVCTQHVCRFTLEKRGILDINSAIQVGVVRPRDATYPDTQIFPPIRTGGASFIESATLRIGATAVATTNSFGRYHTMMRQFKSAEERIRKSGVLEGTVDGLEPSNTEDGGLQPMNGSWGRTPQGIPNTDSPSQLTNLIKPLEEETAVFAIKLSDLFPMMRSVQLPLYLIQEPVSIEIQWSPGDEYTSWVQSDVAANAVAAGSSRIATTQVKFLADYLTYTDDRMAQMAAVVMSESGLQMGYNDLVLTTTTAPGAAAPGGGAAPTVQSVNREIGLSSRTVKNIMWADYLTGVDATDGQLLGVYRSTATSKPSEYNLRINDRELFNRPVVNESTKANYLAQIEGVELQVASCEYSFDQITDHSALAAPRTFRAFGTTQSYALNGISDANFSGHQHYCGVDLVTNPLTGAGTQVGQKPILLQRTLYRGAEDSPANQIITFVWGKVERQFILKNGNVSVTE